MYIITFICNLSIGNVESLSTSELFNQHTLRNGIEWNEIKEAFNHTFKPSSIIHC